MIPQASIGLLLLYLAILLITVVPMGSYLAAVMEGRSRLIQSALPLERRILRFCGANPDAEMDWRIYAISVLLFSALGVLTVYAMERLQGFLPFNPQHFGG